MGYKMGERAQRTQPYDIGIPVFVLSNQARLEVEGIAAIPPPGAGHKRRQQGEKAKQSNESFQ